MAKKKILLGHLNSNGDCLFANVVARQIKETDYPDCHLTWAVNSRCKQSVFLNPYVDEIWEIPTEKTLTSEEEWNVFVAEAERRKANGEFDLIFLTQITGANWLNYDGGIRSSTYNNYPHKITVPMQPIIRLADAEVENVRRFAEKHRLDTYERVILIECAPNSFDVALNARSAYDLASEIVAEDVNTAFIVSSDKQISAARPNIIDGSQLTFRENAELTKYCDLFVGCASGISWLAATDWAKRLDMILVIADENYVFPSMIYDHEYLNLPVGHLIEIRSDERAMEKVKNCLDKIRAEDFARARAAFNEKIEISNLSYLKHQLETTFARLEIGNFFSCVGRTVRRNGLGIIFTARFGRIIWDLRMIIKNKLLKMSGLKRGKDILTGSQKR